MLRLHTPKQDSQLDQSTVDRVGLDIGSAKMADTLRRLDMVMSVVGHKALDNPSRVRELMDKLPQEIPPDVNLRANIAAAQKQSDIEFYEAVRNKGSWDYKQQSPKYQEFGNWHYGVVSGAAGYERERRL